MTGFVEGKPYPMQGPNGQTFATNQYALCALGMHEKAWPFIVCSGDPITEVSVAAAEELALCVLTLPSRS